MNTIVVRMLDRLRETIWFLPLLCGIGAVVLAVLTQWADQSGIVRADWWPTSMTNWQPRSPDGIRAVLTTIAGSMLGMAGVSFSITIVALSLAASQFGSRLLRNFTRDPRNHVVLGILLGVFIYCLVLLGLIRVEDDLPFQPPVVGLPVALLMAATGVGAFVYFVHHIAGQIQANSVIANVHTELCQAIGRFFPAEKDGKESHDSETNSSYRSVPVQEIRVKQSGYVQAVAVDLLTTAAGALDGVGEVRVHPGAYAVEGDVWLRFHRREKLSSGEKQRLVECCLQGERRTMEQDFEFAIHQLVEVAVRALSPGVNDPFTAISCIDFLASAYARIASRHMPRRFFHDGDGELRVVLPELTFGQVLEAGFVQIRQNARNAPAVSIRLLEALDQIASRVSGDAALEAVLRQGKAVAEGARLGQSLLDLDGDAIDERLRRLEKTVGRQRSNPE